MTGMRRGAVSIPKKNSTRRASVRAARAVRAMRTTPHRRSSVGSTFASLGALIIAGALLVGSSVPINLFVTDSSASAVVGSTPAVTAAQTLRVSANAIESAPVRDSFDAVSYAQILALKFAGVDYSYSTTTGVVRWPVPKDVPITDRFGPRDGGFHKGVDFAQGLGTPIYAIADGVAVSSGYDDSGYGNHVVIQHNLGGVNIKSNYAHMILDSSPIVAGQQINVGDFIGLVGDTGLSFGAHLHFEIYVDNQPVEPLAWLQANASSS